MVNVKGQGQFWDRVTEQAQPVAEARQLIETVIPDDSIRDRDVLDAGCGAGDYSAAFLGIGARSVNAFDVSAGSLRLAVNKSSGRFVQASLSELPYRAALFDLIWSWGVLHYVPNTQAALQEMVRVLRPGGTAVIHTLRPGFWTSLELATAAVFNHAPHWMEPIVLSTGEHIIPLLSRLITGRRPEDQTSKTVRQKLHERLFVPGRPKTFTLDQLAAGLGPLVEVTETRPPVADLLKRDMSITIIARKHSQGAHAR